MRVRPLALTLLAAIGLAAPAVAQVAVDEIVIMPERLGPDGRPLSLSRVVTFADLDLRTVAGQDALKFRIRDTARDLCRALDEPGARAGLVTPSCVDQAVSRAAPQMKLAISQALTRTYVAVAPPPPPPLSAAEVGADVNVIAPDPAPPEPEPDVAPEAASYTTTTVTNGAVPDTPENRTRYGAPISNAGKQTPARGN